MTYPGNPHQLGEDGLRLLKDFEGLVLYTYDDFDPKPTKTFIQQPEDAVWGGTLTIGHGHTGPDVVPGLRINERTAAAYLRADVGQAELAVYGGLRVKVRQTQFDALVCFTYNVGAANWRASTLRRKLNDGDDYGAAQEFERWVFSKGKRLKGLERRRAAEKELFLR